MQNSSNFKLGFFSPLAGVGKECGYGYAAFELITAWQRMGIPVWAFDREADVCFHMGQPQFYDYVPGKLNIGYTPWESTGVPSAWVRYMNRMDEIWAPCQANIDWYRDAGVTRPMRVLHHGVNAEHYPVKRRTWDPADGPFKFLHVGEPAPRKGGEQVYRVFTNYFGGDDRVQLTLKGRPRFDVDAPNVKVLPDVFTQEEMTELYLDHHAMVYPTNGEGFGFIPFQAAATGMPTAVTNWSGPVDYMDYCWPINIRPDKDLREAHYEPHVGKWAFPLDGVVENWFDAFYKSPNYFFGRAFQRGQNLHKSWSWDSIAAQALEWMTESLD